ncbi:MAG TPA: DUF3667 domain-containing protein [Steroidobacteraceae bacterium]|jgi:hypothetical protein|nr:DUF3667 domain-containing protein [Steroidobacteraceae bacterium]
MEPAQRFCGACGQRVVATRLTMRDIGHDLVHAITHADHSIFALLKALVLRPGLVAREYVEGKRKKHFGPFGFLIISVGLASFIIVMTGVNWFAPAGDNPVSNFLQRHVNLVILIQMPILALFCWGLFFRAHLHYAEHLILAAYTSGFRALFLGLVEVPLLMWSGATTANPRLVGIYYLLWASYFAFAAYQFYRGRLAWTIGKAVVVVVTTQIAVVAVITVFAYFFMRFVAG